MPRRLLALLLAGALTGCATLPEPQNSYYAGALAAGAGASFCVAGAAGLAGTALAAGNNSVQGSSVAAPLAVSGGSVLIGLMLVSVANHVFAGAVQPEPRPPEPVARGRPLRIQEVFPVRSKVVLVRTGTATLVRPVFTPAQD